MGSEVHRRKKEIERWVLQLTTAVRKFEIWWEERGTACRLTMTEMRRPWMRKSAFQTPVWALAQEFQTMMGESQTMTSERLVYEFERTAFLRMVFQSRKSESLKKASQRTVYES